MHKKTVYKVLEYFTFKNFLQKNSFLHCFHWNVIIFHKHKNTKYSQSPSIFMTDRVFLILQDMFFSTLAIFYEFLNFNPKRWNFFQQISIILMLLANVISWKYLFIIILENRFWPYSFLLVFHISRSFFIVKYVINFVRFLKREYTEKI